jgi:antitoxin ParD1/3/4
MTISVPEALKDFVDAQVGQRGYVGSSEYVRDLIRKDRDRQQLRQLLLDGAATTAGAPADADYFEALRDRVRKARGRPARTGSLPCAYWARPGPGGAQ